MAENKKSIIVYADWIEQFEYLTDEEAGKLIKHFFRYVNDQKPIAPDRLTEMSFIPIKQSLKRDLIKWENTLEGRSRAGKASAEAKKALKEAQQNSTNSTSVDFVQHTSTNSTDSVNVSVSVSDNVNKEINNIDSRKLKFAHTLKPFLNLYDKEVIRNFYEYWTEPNKSNTKYRQELQKTWSTERRLKTWTENNFNNNNKNINNEQLTGITTAIRDFSPNK